MYLLLSTLINVAITMVQGDAVYFPGINLDANMQPMLRNPNYTIRNSLGASSWEMHVDRIISRGLTTLTLAIDKQLAFAQQKYQPGQDLPVVFAPASIAGALALILLGSVGKTNQEVINVMGLATGIDFSSNPQIVHEQFGRILNKMNSRDGTIFGSQAAFATGVFVQSGYPIKEQYKQTSINVYKSEIINLDFKSDSSYAQSYINNWVSDKTRGKIRDILPAPPPRSTEVIIVSALYFKGEWEQPFMTGATQKRPFYPYGRKVNYSVPVDMMGNGGEFKYYKDNVLDCQILALPYKGNTTTMYVIVPNDSSISKLRSLEDQLSSDHIERLLDSMTLNDIILVMPKMTLTSTFSLKDTLINLGVRSLFDPREANLANISPGYAGQQRQPSNQYSAHHGSSQVPVNLVQNYPSNVNTNQREMFANHQPTSRPVNVNNNQNNVYNNQNYQTTARPVNVFNNQNYQTTTRRVNVNNNQREVYNNQNYQTTTRRVNVNNNQREVYNNQNYQTTARPVNVNNNQREVYNNQNYQTTTRPVNVQGVDIYKSNGYEVPTVTYNNNNNHQIPVNQASNSNYQPPVTNRPINYNFQTQNIPQQNHQATEEPYIFSRFGQTPIDCNVVNCGHEASYVGQQNFLYSGRRVIRELNDRVKRQNMDSNPGLYADEILHKVFIDISETGTEAAAATSVSLSRDGSRVIFRVDVPFLFFIRHEETKVNLFWGTVNIPTPNYK